MAQPSKSWPTVPCKGCGRPIVFARNTLTGALVPLDPKPATYCAQEFEGQIICAPSESMVSHFITCPKADHFSGGKKGA